MSSNTGADASPYTDVDNLLNSSDPVKPFLKGTAVPFVLDSSGKPRWQADNSDQILTNFYPDPATGTDGVPFRFVLGSFPNSAGYTDDVYRIGWNIAAGGGQQDPTRPSLKIEMEKDYRTGGKRYCEFHLVMTPPGGQDQRFLTFFGRHDGSSSTVTDNTLGFNVDQLYFHSQTTFKQLWTCDAASGLKLTDIPYQTENSEDGHIHLILNGPTGQSTDYIQVKKNFNTFFTMTKFGEIGIDGGNTGSGAGIRSAMLEITGRAETNNLMVLQDSGGNPRFRVANGSGNYVVIQSTGNLINVGPLTVRKLDASTTAFQVDETGVITLAASATASAAAMTGLSRALGVTVDGLGTFYIPLYTGHT